jgi:hypothetical protein
VREKRNELRVALEHLKVAADLMHLTSENLPDPEDKPCVSYSKCATCNPACLAAHTNAAAQHWVEDAIKHLDAVERGRTLEVLEQRWMAEKVKEETE